MYVDIYIHFVFVNFFWTVRNQRSTNDSHLFGPVLESVACSGNNGDLR